jgi:hypothetical protein
MNNSNRIAPTLAERLIARVTAESREEQQFNALSAVVCSAIKLSGRTPCPYNPHDPADVKAMSRCLDAAERATNERDLIRLLADVDARTEIKNMVAVIGMVRFEPRPGTTR